VVTALSIKDDIIHPTINLDNPDQDCDLDYVANKSRTTSVNIAMTNSLGFGGHNSSLIFSKYLG
jgi:3-oxoacyl-[acyl-carrier-protein] synthase II